MFFTTHFKHKNSPMVLTMLKTVLKTMSNISKCVENHVENFNACLTTMSKISKCVKNHHDVTIMSPLCDPFHQF